MFFHAVHLLNHATAAQAGPLGLHGAQVCALAGAKDAGDSLPRWEWGSWTAC